MHPIKHISLALVLTAAIAYGAATPTIPIATATKAGLVKGGGDGITIGADGTMTATGAGGVQNAAFATYTGAGGGRATIAQLDAKANSSDLAAVATSGDYSSLSGKPTLGTASEAATTDFAAASAFTNYTSADRLTVSAAAATYKTIAAFNSYTSLGGGRPTADEVAATYAPDKSYLDSGVYTAPTISNNNGTITVGTGDYVLYDNATFTGAPRLYTGVAGGVFALADETTSYLVVTYNSGSPAVSVTTDMATVNDSSVIAIHTIYRTGNFIHDVDWDNLAKGLPNKINRRLRRTQRFLIESGLVLSETTGGVINTTSGAVWLGANSVALGAAVQGGGGVTTFFSYHSGGVWARSSGSTAYNNTQYDNGTNLATLTAGRYTVNWVYRGVETPNHIYYILGTGDYTLAQAQSAPEPVKPDIISAHGVLVGRIIVQKNAASATQVDPISKTTFNTAGVTSYNDLTDKPTLGTAAATASTDYATASQGSTADSALQPGDVVNDLTTGGTAVPLSAEQGKVLQDGKVDKDGANYGAPNYFYAAPSWWKWQASRTKGKTNGVTPSPSDIFIIGDSISAYGTVTADIPTFSNYMEMNGLGYTNFYSTWPYLSAANMVVTGCPGVRGDATSPQTWGPGGASVTCSSGDTITYAPADQYRFDSFKIWYEQSPTGGTFTYSVDGAAPVTVNTAGEASLQTADYTGTNQSGAPNIVITTTAGNSVRLYGINTYKRANAGFALHFFQSGGTSLSQWASASGFVAQAITKMQPGAVLVWLGANDAMSGSSIANFRTNLRSFVTTLNIPSSTALVVMTNTSIGLTGDLTTADSASNTLLDGYRQEILSASQDLDFSVIDLRKYWPGYVDAFNGGMMTDHVHPSEKGATYTAAAMASAFFQTGDQSSLRGLRVRDTSLAMASPSAGIGPVVYAGNGTYSEPTTGLFFTAIYPAGVDIKTEGTRMWRFGINDQGVRALSVFPTATNNTIFHVYRHDSSVNTAFSLAAQADHTAMFTGKDFAVTTNGTERFRVRDAGILLPGSVAAGSMTLTGTADLQGNIQVDTADTIDFDSGTDYTWGTLQPILGGAFAGNLSVGAGVNGSKLNVGSWTVAQNVVANQTLFGRNAYYDGAAWRYINTGGASAIRMNGALDDGSIIFSTAPSGTAGATPSAWDTTGQKVIIRNDGKVGMGGNMSPSEVLDVTGNVKASGSLTGATITATGNLTAKTFAATIPAATTYGATTTIDLSLGDSPSVTLTGNPTLAFSNPVAGQWHRLNLIQDATGSRTVTWPSTGLQCTFIKSDGTATATGPTLHTAASTRDTIVIHTLSTTSAECYAAGY